MTSSLPKPMVSPERVEAMWQVSASRILVGPRRRRAALRAGSVALVLIALVSSAVLLRRGQAPGAGAVLATAEAPSIVTLADGSEVRLSPRTGVTLESSGPDEVSLSMHGGRATFAVTHRANRVFKVRAGEVEVRVLGTRFAVDTARGVEVWVEEGVVEVRTGDRVVHLHAGESWRAEAKPETAAAGGAGQGGGAYADEAPAVAAPVGEVEAQPTAPVVEHRVPVRPTKVRAVRSASPSAPVAEANAGPVTAPVAARQESTRDELFAAALEARRSGHTEQARAAWAIFLAHAPDDSRSGLAAFELGRIAMDVDHQDALALTYLERALNAAPASAFVEDALARVVRLEARHGLAACREAKARYEAQFPHGAYAASLATLCP